MNMFFKTFLLPFFSISCFASASLSLVGYSNESKTVDHIYNASITEQSVQYVFNDLMGYQEDLFLNNYSTVYFSHLNNNFPINSHGTCSIVAISMLLSFYDSYWDDDFVDTVFEQDASFAQDLNCSQTFPLPSFDTESPGIVSEELEDVENLTNSAYLNYVSTHQNICFQSYLINLAYNLFSNYGLEDPNNDNPFGLTVYEQTNLISYYLIYHRYISSNRAIVYTLNGNSNGFYDSIVDFIVDGMPILLNVYSTSIGYHTVLAYDYDSYHDEIYVHSGWKDDNGNCLNHVSLDDLDVIDVESAVVIEVTNDHSESYHYYCGQTARCACSMVYPQNLVRVGGNYYDVAPSFKWDSIHREKWFDDAGSYIELSFLNYGKTLILSKNISLDNECGLTLSEWNSLLNSDSYSFYYVRAKLKSNNYLYLDYECTTLFGKPSSVCTFETIMPSDMSEFTNGYATQNNVDTVFISHTKLNGFLFKTRRYRAGLDGGEITLSSKKTDFNHAFIEYQFIVPIDRIDIQLSHWSNDTNSNLNSDNGDIAVIQEYRYNEYKDRLNLLSPQTGLSADRNSKTIHTICFDRPITRIRIYSSTGQANVNNDDQGRICVGSIKVYENLAYNFSHDYVDMEPTGSEIEYNPTLWNDGSTIQAVNNCYTYALNVFSSSHVEPGEIGCPYFTREYDTINNLAHYLQFSVIEEMVNFDSQPNALTQYGFDFALIFKNQSLQSGFYRTALVFDLVNRDYHWYRQNPDGSWSHKPGSGKVRNFDFDGNPIFDPEFCNRKSNGCIQGEKSGIDLFDYSGSIVFYSLSLNVSED